MKIPLAFLLVILLLAAPACNPLGGLSATPMAARPDNRGIIIKTNSRGRGYATFVPIHYDPAKKYPLIVFLHGQGEGGSNPAAPTSVGIGQAIAKFVAQQGDFPFLVIFPQSEQGQWVDQVDYNDVYDEIALTTRQYSVDANHISITGISTGGYGTFVVAGSRPELFSCMAPMDPAMSGAGYAEKLAGMNIWAFDNKFDPIGGYAYNKASLKAISDAGGHPRHTTFESSDHDCWTEAYVEPGFFQFLRDSVRMP